MLLALSAGLGWGVFRYLLHPTFIDATQVRDVTGLPVLGSVGLYLTDEHRNERRMQVSSFLIVLVLLFVVFGGVAVFKDRAVSMVSQITPVGGQIA